MSLPKVLVALCVLTLASADRASAQSQPQSDYWGKPADLKPMLPLIPPLLLPPNSSINAGSLSGEAPSSYSTTPGYDARREAPAPGLRLTIPTR